MLNLINNLNTSFKSNYNLIIFIVSLIKLSTAVFFFSPLPEQHYILYLQKIINNYSIFVDHDFIIENPELHFPYGLMMIIIFYPFFILSNIFQISPDLSYFGTLFCADLLTFLILGKMVNITKSKLILLFWMNPIIFIVTYYLGFNDIIPTLFLVLTIYYLQIHKYFRSALAISIAVSCKFSMFLIIPVLIIYLYQNKLVRHNLTQFSIYSFFFLIILNFPQFFNEISIQMFSKNPNALESIFVKGIEFGSHTLLVMPIFYSFILMLIWNIGRLNFTLFLNISFILFLTIIFLINSSPGWYIWVVPLFILFSANFSIKDNYLISLFVILIFIEIMLIGPLGFYNISFYSVNLFKFNFLKQYINIIHSVFFAVGIILIYRLWKLGINENYYFKIWRKPFLIGVSGNSGVGKTTLTKNLEEVLGQNSVTNVKGDGYHVWDRNRLIWQTMTHLNPRANQLDELYEDVRNLIFGKKINIKAYDHKSGKKHYINNVIVKNFVLLEGLHILIFKKLREKCDIKIFMDISEKLRRDLKIDRDTKQRGYKKLDVLNKIKKRKVDEIKYIETQRKFSDLVINVKETKNYSYVKNKERLIVEIISKDPTYFIKLSEVLTKITNIGFETNFGIENKMTFYGHISKTDVIKVAKEMMSNYHDIFMKNARWSCGAKGIVQLISSIEVYQQIMKRMN